jgi:hypothetical protein
MQERANKLYEVIIQRMDLVMIELNEYDDPQVIFEALNGRGTPLLPSDLIKNHIFETIRPFCIDQDPMPYYHEFWNFFDSKNEAIQDVESENPPKFWKKEVKQGRLFRPRIDLFLFHYLQCKRAGEVSISELFREFKDWWVSQPHDTLGEITRNLSDLKLYAGFFEKFLTAKREDGDIETRLWRFRSIDTGTIYPVLLFLFSESECNPSKIDKASLPLLLADMESYLVRRGVCGLTGKNYNKIFIKLLGDLRELISVDSHAIGRLLVKGKDTTNSFPTDEEFKRAWLSRSIYSPGLSSFINMILASINEAMRTDAQERAFIEYAGLSVEHVMPRGWREYWPLADGDKTHHEDPISRLPVTNQQWRESQIDTIGNLTLLTSKLNEKISNGPFENSERPTDKRREYKKHTLLRITQMIANRDHWNEQEIQDRANRLFEYAVKIWPYPNM